ncbi:DsbA family protein [Arthrobacter rhombi]|uniref:DsbA family protein n=1 Tax=Arthrobacter rhombi TaxID=71253 RepID=UPI000B35585D|nr:DsbA family protein [Arthrobacter rhombi]
MPETPVPDDPSTPARRNHGARSRKLPWVWIIPIPVALIIGLLIGIQLPFGNGAASEPAPDAAPQEQQQPPQQQQAPGEEVEVPDMARVDPEDPTAVGDVDAPVVMVAYSDFQCPYCAKWTANTLPTLMDKYVETGKLRIEWRDLDIFGDESLKAAEAAQAAAMQDGYLDFHEEMSKGGKIAKASAFEDKNLKATAEKLGMDGDQLIKDMNGVHAPDVVQQNIDEAMELGVTSTPSFLLNKTPFVGAQPTENFIEAIDKEIKAAEKDDQ